MVRCPNCGQKTSGDYCQWCKYPILRGKSEKRRKVQNTRKAKETPKSLNAKSSELYTGPIELVLLRPLDFDQVGQFEEYLKQVEDLSLEWSGGSVDEGTVIAIHAHRPLPLINILKGMPQVEKVEKKGEKITIRLKAPTSS